jgi:hypothetical protein
MCMYNRPLPDLGTADDRTLLTTNDRNTGSSRPIKCIAHKISRLQHHGFWHGYVFREEGTHCILLIALCKSRLTPAHCISLIVYLTSYILYHIVSYSVLCDMYMFCVQGISMIWCFYHKAETVNFFFNSLDFGCKFNLIFTFLLFLYWE